MEPEPQNDDPPAFIPRKSGRIRRPRALSIKAPSELETPIISKSSRQRRPKKKQKKKNNNNNNNNNNNTPSKPSKRSSTKRKVEDPDATRSADSSERIDSQSPNKRSKLESREARPEVDHIQAQAQNKSSSFNESEASQPTDSTEQFGTQFPTEHPNLEFSEPSPEIDHTQAPNHSHCLSNSEAAQSVYSSEQFGTLGGDKPAPRSPTPPSDDSFEFAPGQLANEGINLVAEDTPSPGQEFLKGIRKRTGTEILKYNAALDDRIASSDTPVNHSAQPIDRGYNQPEEGHLLPYQYPAGPRQPLVHPAVPTEPSSAVEHNAPESLPSITTVEYNLIPDQFSQLQTLYKMSENVPPAGAPANGDVPGQPYYEKTRRHLQELLRKKALISNNLTNLEDQIYKKETEYLEETPSGNIITGFENYTKGTSTGIGGGRKRGNVVDGNRVFSKSSISYNINAVRLPN
jgi:hypothetical protein